MAAGFNDIKVNKLLSPALTVKGGSCPLSGSINSRLPAQNCNPGAAPRKDVECFFIWAVRATKRRGNPNQLCQGQLLHHNYNKVSASCIHTWGPANKSGLINLQLFPPAVAASLFARRCLMCAKVPAVVPLARSGSIWQSGTFIVKWFLIVKAAGRGREAWKERNQVIGVRIVFNGDR